LCASSALAADWEASITAGAPGPFPPPRSLVANYHFGWAGFTGGTGEVRFSRKSSQRFQFDGAGRTIGFVRALWKLDVTQRAWADAETLRPIELEQAEMYRSKKIVTKCLFNATGVTRIRSETKRGATVAPTTKQLNRANLFDLHSALLYLRSQPLRDRSVQRIAVFPAASAYVATLTVTGREKISVAAGTFNAIKCDLQLNRIGKKGELEPHKKFRRGTIWISDDADRVVLRVEAQIFVGTVFAELQSVRYESAKK
jgi:hypothetical protein